MSTPGPSRPRYQSTLPEYRPPRAFSSRPSTPSQHTYNSHGFITTPAFANDSALRSQWHDSVNRLQKVWDDLITRYEKVDVDDQGDDIDITTGKVILDRGHLRGLERKDFYLQGEGDGFGMGSEDGEVEEEREFESDEDELSVWDERSRLETQGLESEEEVKGVWTQEDEDDMQAFLKAEERRKSLMGDDAEEEEEELALEGTKQVARDVEASPTLEDLFADEAGGAADWESDSEDELLAQTSDAEDASRVMLISSPLRSLPSTSASYIDPLVPNTRAKATIEVIIPVRARSHAPTTSQPPPVTLDDLFSPPPPALSSLRPNAPIRSTSLPDKGKQRMRGERPSEDPPLPTTDRHITAPAISISESAYLTTVWHTRNGVTLRRCKACVAAGGDLGEKAEYCRGRVGVGRCPFESKSRTASISTSGPSSTKTPFPTISPSHHSNDPKSSYKRALTAPAGSAQSAVSYLNGITTTDDEDDIPLRLPVSTLSTSRRHRRSSTRGPANDLNNGSSSEVPDVEAQTSPRIWTTPIDLDRTRYYAELNWPSNSSVPRVCRPCDDAGGKRKNAAPWCKGRWRARECSFSSTNLFPTKQKRVGDDDDLESLASDMDDTGPSSHRKVRIPDIVNDNLDSLSDSPVPSIYRNPNSVQRRRCGSTVGTPAPPGLDSKRYGQKSYMIVGGKNERSCKYCVAAGGRRKEMARWCKGSVWAKKCSFLLEGGEGEAGGGSEKEGRSSEETRPPVTPGAEDQVLEFAQYVMGREATRSESVGPVKVKRKRGRVIHSAEDPVVIHVNATVKNSTPVISIARNERSLSRPPIIHKQVSLPSPAPSGEIIDQAPVKATRILRASSSISSLPPSSPPAHLSTYLDRRAFTPSPSLCNIRSHLAPGSTGLSPAVSSPIRRIAALRGKSSLLPTPPTSVTGSHRGSSVSSSTAFFDSARKGILRRPSDLSSSSQPPSAKRIRFSMIPRSPTRSSSADPHAQGEDDPDSDDELLLRPITDTPSSSPFPTSDNYNDGSCSSPFPSGLHVRAADVGLSLGLAHTGRLPRTLLNALTPSMTGGYILPSPPPVPRERTTTSSQKGLMLPPPIPLSSKRSQMPLRQSSTDSIQLTQTTLEGPLTTNVSEHASIKAKQSETKPSQPRARSRSLSTQPVVQRISLASFPSSTPRRNAKFERELAKVAREAGDEAGLEWGMDEDVGLEIGRMWRGGSVVRYVT